MNVSRSRNGHGTTPEVSLVFPMYNPGARLQQSLIALDSFTQSTDLQWEFVFVDDGCTDESAALIRTWQLTHKSVRLLEYKPNRGKGFAVRQGLIAASAPYRMFTDIDLAYSFDDIIRVANSLRNGADVTIASRSHVDSWIQLRPELIPKAFCRHVQSQVFSWLARAVLPIKHRDTQAGLKGLSESAVGLLMPRLTCDGFGFDCELLTACERLGLRVSEVPASVRFDHAGSTTNVRSTIKMIIDLFRIRRAWPASVRVADSQFEQMARYREAG